VVISARNQAPCDEVAAAIRQKGGEADRGDRAHTADRTQLETSSPDTREWGRVDILGATPRSTRIYGSLADLSDRPSIGLMTNNVLKQSLAVEDGRPEMRERHEGSIIYIISDRAPEGLDG